MIIRKESDNLNHQNEQWILVLKTKYFSFLSLVERVSSLETQEEEERVSYEGYQVIRASASTHDQLDILKSIGKSWQDWDEDFVELYLMFRWECRKLDPSVWSNRKCDFCWSASQSQANQTG